jgi:hypothetical protein
MATKLNILNIKVVIVNYNYKNFSTSFGKFSYDSIYKIEGLLLQIVIIYKILF